ncbi:MAG: glycosyltransferase [Opitutales bacterium]|jgi:glycosyltransferase involved in cell wall biosynthesis|nr:glycosyltransferase [Opitutales bacterium]MBT5170116.1 glycosyltransferase [Opitutales bacterium]MBT5814017.1 glycosyltransferase [Opitutales bacterium]MDG2254718.1 glycosyltransferase [Opitutaceae bacterium]
MIKGRILFDVTKASRQRQKSGLARVSSCLKHELQTLLGARFLEVIWDGRKETFRPRLKQKDFRVEENDVFLTGELFCEFERVGVERLLREWPCHAYAIFHDAIPMQHPEFTWPHSVQRHPSYMKMLTLFTGVFGVSSHSSILLEEYWEWLDVGAAPSVKSIQLGADGVFAESSPPKTVHEDRLQVMMLGIVEKRKGQDLALQAARFLWDEGLEFDLHIVGRTNPYFGKTTERLLKDAAKAGYPVRLHGQVGETALQQRFLNTDLILLPSLAEGCGLPVLESLWKGVPTLSSGLHSVRENSRFGGCELFDTGNVKALTEALRSMVLNRRKLQQLTDGIQTSILPRWEKTARDIIDHMVTEGG